MTKKRRRDQHMNEDKISVSAPNEPEDFAQPGAQVETVSSFEAAASESAEDLTSKEKRKMILRLEEEISLYEGSLEILKSRKQEVLTQLELKRSQKYDVMQEQSARTEQKKRLMTTQVRHLQLLQELRKSLSKSQERLKRLVSLSDGILSEDEIAKLNQELAKPEKNIRTRSSSSQQHGQSEETVEATDSESLKSSKPLHPSSSSRAFSLRNIYDDKKQLANFWECQGEAASKPYTFLPCIHSKYLLVKIMDICARETLALDSLDLQKSHRREALESTCLDLSLCTFCAAIPKQHPIKAFDLSSKSSSFGCTIEQLEKDCDVGKTQKSLTDPTGKPNAKECDSVSSTDSSPVKRSSTGQEKSDTLMHYSSYDDNGDNDKFADAEDDDESNLSCRNEGQDTSTLQGNPSEPNLGKNQVDSEESPDNSDDDSPPDKEIPPVLDWSKVVDRKLCGKRRRSESASVNTRDMSNKETPDSDAPLCPYELAGVCADAYCPYQHLEDRKHGKLLPRELLPLPVLKLPPEPSPADQAAQTPIHETSPNSDKTVDNLPAEECQVNQESVPKDPDRSSRSTGVSVGVIADKRTSPETCYISRDESKEKPHVAEDVDKDKCQEEESPCKKQCNDNAKNLEKDSVNDKIAENLIQRDSIAANDDFISLDVVPLDSFEPGEASDDEDVDFVTAYFDGVEASKQRCSWWMTPEQSTCLQQLSTPISVTDWLGFCGFRVTGRKGSKLFMESIDTGENETETILLGRIVDCMRLAIHAGRFDASGALLCLADETISSLHSNRLLSKIFRDVIKCVKRVDACAYERQTSFRATFDLQLLLAVISVFVQQLHDKTQSDGEGLNEQTHGKWAKDLYDVCRALQPPNGERGQKVIRSPDNLILALRQNLFQLSPSASKSLDLCSYNEESNCGCLKILSLLSDVRLGKSLGLNMVEATSLSTLSDDILMPAWSIVKTFLRQHNVEDRQTMYLRGCIFIGYILFGTLENAYQNFGKQGMHASEVSILIQINQTIQRILLALREAISDDPFAELLLSPLFAGCASLSTFLRLYGKAQHQIETFLWVGAGGSKNDGSKVSRCTLSVYSELLWSQLVQLRASLPFCEQVAGDEDLGGNVTPLTLPTDISDCHKLLAVRIKQYGIHPHHICLYGDWNLLYHLKNTKIEQTTNDKKISEKNSLIVLEETYYELVHSTFPHKKSSKKGGIESFDLSNVPVTVPEGKKVSSDRSAFPQTLLVTGKVISMLNLSACELANIPVSFGLYFSRLKKLDLSCNQLRILPDSIALISGLQELNVSRNELSLIPETIGSLEGLRNLDLSYNSLQALPSSLERCKNLEQLNVIFNCLSPASDVFPLTKLTKLRMLKFQPQSVKAS